MAAFVPVFKLSQLPAGHMHQITFEEKPILLINVDDEIFAVDNACSHYGLPLHNGALSGHRLRCPFHHACFDVRNGDQLEAPGMDGLNTYPVKVEGDAILVMPTPTARRENSAPAPAPKDSTTYDYAIIGGGIAALNAILGIRENDPQGSIVMISREELTPYDRTNVSKGLLSGGAAVTDLTLKSDDFYDQYGVTRKMGQKVERLDPEKKIISLSDGTQLDYGKVLLATGGNPREIQLPGSNLKNIFLVRNAKDGDRAKSEVSADTEVVIIGGSFIGMEAAMGLGKLGGKITVVTPEPVPFANVFGPEIGGYVRDLHEAAGVTFRFGRMAESFRGSDRVSGVVLDDGTVLPAQVVIIGIGVIPATEFINGLSLDDDGGVPVNEFLATAVEGTFAAGDIARYPSQDEKLRIEHWKVAAQQGRVAGRNMAGAATAYGMMPFFWTNQQGVNFRYVGHATDYDQVLLDGEPGKGPFLAFYLKGGQLQAVLGVKRDAETAAIGELMAAGKMPAADALIGADWQGTLREA
jgi:NADPH-dependent 2,4-dienoyl-CoA reductase/sulfur reductase-like enzyme/nitrite reductase/ring-hydroxylating ferredoxin subunit